MAPTPRKASNAPYSCELSLQPLRNCLVNLPSPLVSVLLDANIIAQNVIIELTWRVADKKDGKSTTTQRSAYLGWTGMQSKSKQTTSREQASPVIELDSTFATMLGLTDALKVAVLLHNDFPSAHTINIEPLTPADWEIIELHAGYLETHFLHQVRAMPNPLNKSQNHPITLHLSPTSTANVLVTALKPAPSSASPFAKISTDAEVIVAPKSRQRTNQFADEDIKSIGSRSATSARPKSARQPDRRPATYLRAVDRHLASEWFDDHEDLEKNVGLRIWVDWSVVTSKDLRAVSWVAVSVLRPSGLQQALEEEQDAIKLATTIVARILPWEDAPDSRHTALSTQLCELLDLHNALGDTIRIEPAPTQLSKSAVRSLKIFPFAPTTDRQKDGFKFGSKSKAESQEASQRIMAMFSKTLLDGPITDGMILPQIHDPSNLHMTWPGGILKFHPPPGALMDLAKTTRGWLLASERKIFVVSPTDSPNPKGNDRKLQIEAQAEASRPLAQASKWAVGEAIATTPPELVGIDIFISQLLSQLQHGSSTLLTGGLGSGKTSLAQLLAHRLRKESLFNITYFPCRTILTEETRISTIKETMTRTFALAQWNARLGGKSLVILDDLDALCPVETELEVADNARSRHVSEILMAIVRQYTATDSRVVLLTTAQSKEAVHNVLIGGHIVRDIVHLQAPDKESRRKVIEMLAHKDSNPNPILNGHPEDIGPQGAMSNTISVDPSIDFLDLAGRTDGYMPADLALLVTRARSEGLIRSVSSSPSSDGIQITLEDFINALKDFTPASLRNVTLQRSTTSFSSIGGLQATRQILLETLQYPTLYAPIFARCPLRLRSGLLLYGYPGCGKTLLASAVAGECGLNFISVKGPEILNKYIGASEKSVRDLFERAQAARPCVLFFDEFDSVAPKRGHDSTGVTDRVVNQLLTQMDGAEGLSGVYVLAATSRPDMIDPALLRPGRLDKSLLCDMPTSADRLDILRALSTTLTIDAALLDASSSRTLHELATRTPGFTGADLQALVYNAQLEAIHDALGDRPGSAHAPTQTTASGPPFTYFPLDAAPIPTSASQRAAERAAIAASLLAHRATQQRARAARRSSTTPEPNAAVAKAVRAEPTIRWTHLERALAQTRPSIGADEVQRLARIYREFVVGRNGEMPSGQGGSEIGGRSSLM